jgi:hypothetical protein
MSRSFWRRSYFNWRALNDDLKSSIILWRFCKWLAVESTIWTATIASADVDTDRCECCDDDDIRAMFWLLPTGGVMSLTLPPLVLLLLPLQHDLQVRWSDRFFSWECEKPSFGTSLWHFEHPGIVLLRVCVYVWSTFFAFCVAFV